MLKIFPAWINPEGQKVPLITGWQQLASNDPNQIKLWQEVYRNTPRFFFGIPTGEPNGIVAVDIDVKPNKKTGQPRNGWQSLANLGYQIQGDTLRQRTPSGGTHLIFRAAPGVKYGNSVNEELGVDVRGDGGWIGFYGFENAAPILDAPEWITKLSPNSCNKSTYNHEGAVIKVSPEIAQGIVQASLEAIENAPPGSSNDTLNTESFRLGQLVASESITREYAEQVLFAAAKKRGKPDYEAKATIKSGLDGGSKKPLTSAFSNEAPQIKIQIPAPPAVPDRWTPKKLTREDLNNVTKLRKPQLFQDWTTEDIHLLTADGGTGKTTLVLQEAICLALGDPFLGFDNKQRGNTLYITGEDTREKLGAMLGAMLRQMKLLDSDDPVSLQKVQTVMESIHIMKDADLCIVTKDRQGFINPSTEALNKILQAVEDVKPKLIVMDPIASFWGSEAALNDMAKAVAKFAARLVETADAAVLMINHMGKQSSQNKDMTQFAGRGGSGLPSHARVVRSLRPVWDEEYLELTGEQLPDGHSCMMCVISKFSDGSGLLNKPFLIIRQGYLFGRKVLSEKKQRDVEQKNTDVERIFTFIKEQRALDKYPTKNVVVGYFMSLGTEAIGIERTKRALDWLQFTGHLGEKIKMIENPDHSIKDKAFVIIDSQGKELVG